MKRKQKTAEELGPRKAPIVEHSRSGERIVGWIDKATGKRIDAEGDKVKPKGKAEKHEG